MKKNEKKSEHKILKSIYRMLLPIVGIICIVIPSKVVLWLPAVLGSIMLLTGLIDSFFEVKDKKYLKKEQKYEKKASALILVVMGACFLLGGEKTILLMGVTWGLMGLQEVNEELKVLLMERSEKRPWRLKFFGTAFKLILSLALIFEPIEKFGHHIILLGVEIIIVTLKGSDVLLCKEEIHQKLNCKKILKEE